MVNSKLYVDFLVRIKYVGFKLDGCTLILSPRWNVWQLVSSLLKGKTCAAPRVICSVICTVLADFSLK